MCGGPEQTHVHAPHPERESPFKARIGPASSVKKKPDCEELVKTSSSLLELAANDDLNRFAKCVEEQNVKVDEVGLWYVRHSGTSQMVLEQRTPAMVAALYGSMEVLAYIVNHYAMHGGDIDQVCGCDGSTAMHCAAAGGSTCAVQIVQLLLNAGANVNVCDSEGRRPVDVLAVPLIKADVKITLEGLLNQREQLGTSVELGTTLLFPFEHVGLRSSMKSCSSSSALSTASGVSSLSMSLSASSSPKSPHTMVARGLGEDSEIAREFSLDTSLPDIKNTFYSNDEFRMYSFKIRPCSRAYSHDWTECPFAHPGENARRRDPRKYHYSCVPCPDFRRGACSQGDACEYSHGVFECWLHPAQYRTRLCKDGVECNRKVCFFAHRQEELRPVYASTGSGLPSPMSTTFLDVSCMSPPPLAPCSPSVIPPYSPLNPGQSTLQSSVRTPPISPVSSAWPQASIPTLQLPGASLQFSRLRSASSARDVSANSSFDEQLINEFQSLSAHHVSTQARRPNAAMAASKSGSASSQSGRYKSLGLTLAPANLEELFATESMAASACYVREANMLAQLEQASPQKRLNVNAAQGSVMQSPKEVPCLKLGSIFSGALKSKGPSATGGQGVYKGAASPTLVAARAALSQGSRSSRELATGKDWWADWGSPTGKLEWGLKEDDLSNLRKSASFRMRGSMDPEAEPEPDLSWVQRLVKEDEVHGVAVNAYRTSATDKVQREDGADMAVLPVLSWVDNLCIDQVAA